MMMHGLVQLISMAVVKQQSTVACKSHHPLQARKVFLIELVREYFP